MLHDSILTRRAVRIETGAFDSAVISEIGLIVCTVVNEDSEDCPISVRQSKVTEVKSLVYGCVRGSGRESG